MGNLSQLLTEEFWGGNTKKNVFILRCFKPIFHWDAKPFALGIFASPNAKDTNMLVSFALGDAIFLRHPTRNPNTSQWNIGCVGSQTQNSGVGHVHLMFFVLISFASGSQCEPLFQWNMGLRIDKGSPGSALHFGTSFYNY